MADWCDPRGSSGDGDGDGGKVGNGRGWKRVGLGEGAYPAPADADRYCDWKEATATAVPFRMCTYSRSQDGQVSTYIHKEGVWNAHKKEIFERILPIAATDMDMPERMLVIDVGANIGFYTLLAATRGYDVIALEPAQESVVRLLYSLEGNGMHAAGGGGASGPQRVPAVYVYENAGSDTVTRTYMHFVSDNPGATWLDAEYADREATTVLLDDLLEDAYRDPSAGERVPKDVAPSLDPSRVRVIKISAEGMDSRVLNGMRRLLSSGDVPFVMFVYNDAHVRGQGCRPSDMILQLFGHGYRLYHAGVYIYREQELQRFIAGMTRRSSELLFVGPNVEFNPRPTA